MGNCLQNDDQTGSSIVRADSMSDLPKTPSDFSTSRGTKAHNKLINKHLSQAKNTDDATVKILLLGTGSSGKSTIFRQIECIHGDEKGKQSLDRFFLNIDAIKAIIRFNCIDGLIKLLKKSDFLSKQPYNFKQCLVDCGDSKIENGIKLLVEFAQKKNSLMNNHEYDQHDLATLGKTMRFLWNLDGVRETFKLRQYFSLAENLNYFMEKINVVMDSKEYEPTVEDIIYARMQTTGIIERTYFIEDIQFNVFDVGGQRNERKKWLQLFDNVTALIFVAALNHYCCVLFEDERVNSMQESFKVFAEIVNSKWFSSKHNQFILFLNKNDLFVQRLRADEIPLSVCFGDGYVGPNYGDKRSEEAKELAMVSDDAWFDHCYAKSVKFIMEEYRARNTNPKITSIFIHITTATQQSNIEIVFHDVRIGIIQRNLANSHLIGAM